MSSIALALDTPFAEALGWALLHFLWQGTVVALALALVLVLLRGSTPGARYGAACVALALVLAAPAATFVVLLNGGGAAGQEGRLVLREREGVGTGSEGAVVAAPLGSGSRSGAGEPPGNPLTATTLSAVARWAPVVWGAGVLLLTVVYAVGWSRAAGLAGRGAVAAPAAWGRRVVELGRVLGLRRPVRLLASEHVRGPVVVGLLRPAVVVPVAAFGGLAPQHLEAILAHELAHVRRHDALVTLLQAVAEVLFFYHPAVWWISASIRAEREHCCDDLAVRSCGMPPRTLARALLEVAELGRGLPAAALAATGGSLSDRVRRLLGRPARAERRAGRARMAGAIGGLTVLMVALAAGVPQGSRAAVDVQGSPWEVSTGSALRGVENLGASPGVTADRTAAEESPSMASEASRSAAAPSSESPPMVSEASNSAAAPASPSQAAASSRPGSDWRQGTWRAEARGERVHLDMRLGTAGDRTHWGQTLTRAELGLGAEPGPVRFALVRDAGSFLFEGALERDGQGSGSFRFEPDREYAGRLQGMGYQVEDEGRLLQLAIHDVSEAFLREMDGLGYGGEGLDRMIEFRIHGVDGEYVRALAAAGYVGLPAARLVEGRIHGVSAAWLAEMEAAGLRPAEMSRAVEMRIHGVEPELVRALRAEGYEPSADQVVALRIHGVTLEGIRELEASGLGELSLERAVELAIHGVDGTYVRSLEAAGVRDLDASSARDLKIHGVEATWVAALAQAGYGGLPAPRLQEMRIHGVDASWIADLAAVGYDELSADRLVAFRIHGVDRAWIEELREVGLAEVPASLLLDLRIHGVTADFVRRAREMGYTELSAERLLDLKIHGLDRWAVDARRDGR